MNLSIESGNGLPLLFFMLTLLAVGLMYRTTQQNKPILVLSIAFMILYGLLSGFGFFMNTDAVPPRFIFIFAGIVFYTVFSIRQIKQLQLKRHALLLLHGLRIPVELTLYQLAQQKLVPDIMTFNGWNFDIVIGLSALLILFYEYVTQKRIPTSLFRMWNVLGLGFLFFIVGIAILSLPLPFQQLAMDQPNKAVMQFPYVYLPLLIVPMVFISHIMLLTKHQD